MGFSPIGLGVALAVLAPTLLLIGFPPRTPLPAVAIPVALQWAERIGQALCLVVPAITSPGGILWPWSVLAGGALLGYYALWARYFITGRAARSLYRTFWILPVPLAVLPVVAFLGTAAWLANPWIALSAAILAAGHIPASALVARSFRAPAAG